MKFKEHFKYPQNQMKPSYFSVSSVYKNREVEIELFLDIDSKDQIKLLTFTQVNAYGWLPYLSALSLMAKDKSLEEALSFSQESFLHYFKEDDEYLDYWSELEVPIFNLSLMLLKSAIEDYTGRYKTTQAELKRCREEELLCRCFGVYESELVDLIKNNPTFEVKDVIEKTYMSAGCGNCEADLDDVYLATRALYPMTQKEAAKAFHDYTHVEKILKLEELMTEFCQSYQIQNEQIEIVDLEDDILILKFHNLENGDPKRVIEKLESFFKTKKLDHIKLQDS